MRETGQSECMSTSRCGGLHCIIYTNKGGILDTYGLSGADPAFLCGGGQYNIRVPRINMAREKMQHGLVELGRSAWPQAVWNFMFLKISSSVIMELKPRNSIIIMFLKPNNSVIIIKLKPNNSVIMYVK